MRRLRQLEEENRRLNVDRGRPGAGYSGAQGPTGKKRLRPAVKRQLVVEVMTTHELSQRRACGLIGITRRGLKRAPVVDRNRGLRQRLRELQTVKTVQKHKSTMSENVRNIYRYIHIHAAIAIPLSPIHVPSSSL